MGGARRESADAMKPAFAKNPPRVELRPVAPPDEGFLVSLYAATRADELARSGWDAAQRDAFVRAQYQIRRTHYALQFPGAEHQVILVEGRAAGVWMVWRAADQIRLVNIELQPAHQNQGIGSTLIRRLIAEAKPLRLPVRLSVRDNNSKAMRLYRHLGFTSGNREAGYLSMEHTL